MQNPAAILERSQWDHFWIPPNTVAHERAGLAYLSSAQDIPHLNAVLRTDLNDDELEAAVSEVVNAHRGVHSRWQVYSRIDREALRKALAAGGYSPTTHLDARAISAAAHRPRPAPDCHIARVSEIRTLIDFHAVANAAFALQRRYSEEQLESQLRQCAAPESRVQRFVAYRGERAISCGGLNAFDALGLGLLWAGSTIPEARGRGFYSALLTACMAWALQRGLSLVGLYAIADTSSPIAGKQGFAKHGTLTYWERSS